MLEGARQVDLSAMIKSEPAKKQGGADNMTWVPNCQITCFKENWDNNLNLKWAYIQAP